MTDTLEPSRLLRHLLQPDTFACLSPLGCGRLALYREAGGTTLGAGYATVEEAQSLVAEGLAAWTGRARRRS